jgi:hypothetical protein
MPPTPTKKSDEQRICRKHGLTAFVHEPSKAGTGYRCRLCRVEAITTKRRALKQRLADHLGGSCSDCGYNRWQGCNNRFYDWSLSSQSCMEGSRTMRSSLRKLPRRKTLADNAANGNRTRAFRFSDGHSTGLSYRCSTSELQVAYRIHQPAQCGQTDQSITSCAVNQNQLPQFKQTVSNLPSAHKRVICHHMRIKRKARGSNS